MTIAAPGPAMGARELAAELNRSETWLYEHWRDLVAAGRLPPPLLGGQSPLSWSRAHVYAVLDKPLPAAARTMAMAYRAAAAAAAGAPHVAADNLRELEDRAALDQRFVR